MSDERTQTSGIRHTSQDGSEPDELRHAAASAGRRRGEEAAGSRWRFGDAVEAARFLGTTSR